MSRLQEDMRRLKLSKADTKEKLIDYGKEKDFDGKNSPTVNPSKLLNNKKVKIESRDFNRNLNDEIEKAKNIQKNFSQNPQVNTGDLKLPDINKNKALKKLRQNLNINLENYRNKNKGISMESENKLINSALKEEINVKNSIQRLKKIRSNTGSINDNPIEEKKNTNNIPYEQDKKQIKHNREFSPKVNSKNSDDSLNSDINQEKENDDNINEISNMMKDILNY